MHELARKAVVDDYVPGLPVGIEATPKDDLGGMEGLSDSPAVRKFTAVRSAWRDRLPDEDDALFDHLLDMPQWALLDLLAFCVAATVDVVASHETMPAPMRSRAP